MKAMEHFVKHNLHNRNAYVAYKGAHFGERSDSCMNEISAKKGKGKKRFKKGSSGLASNITQYEYDNALFDLVTEATSLTKHIKKSKKKVQQLQNQNLQFGFNTRYDPMSPAMSSPAISP